LTGEKPEKGTGRKPAKAAQRKSPHGPAVPRQVLIYTDGACRGNPGVGAFAAVLRCDEYEKELSGAEPHTTNNRMELMAAIAGLETLTERCAVKVFTDSQYVKKGMTEWISGWIAKGWRTSSKKPVLNKDLWERLLELTRKHDVEWNWVEGHAGDELNERCDALANRAIDQLLHGSRHQR